MIWITLANIFEERAILASSVDILNQLEARRQIADSATMPAGAVPAGSPFLGGETITVAGAALLQRVAGAITRVGGSVQSSQVDLQGPKSKDGFITLLISCEMGQANLQKLLYDLEAGMPFLFIDQLVVQGPQESAVAGNARMRILVAVSGQWKGTN
jgi:general secretion pathway protein M